MRLATRLPLLLVGGLVAAFPAESRADPFTAGCTGARGDSAALVAAIAATNANGPGADTLQLAAGCAYVLTAADNNWFGPNGLPPVAGDLTIEGNGATISRLQTAPPFRFFFVGADPAKSETDGYVSPGPGSLTLRNLTLSGGLARGGDSSGGGGGAGMGGAIFSQGTVLIENSTFTGDTARGGSAVNPAAGSGGGGIGSSSSGPFGAAGGFGTGTFGGGSGGTSGSGLCGGGGAGFRSTGENGGNGTSGSTAGPGGGPATGSGGAGGGGGGTTGAAAGDASGGAGCGNFSTGGAGGAFGAGGQGGSRGGGGGGIGGGGGGGFGGTTGGGGGGGFGGGGGAAQTGSGGAGGFGGGGGQGFSGGGAGGFGGGSATSGQGGGGAGMGGAIFNMQGQLTVRNSTFAGNRALAGTDSVASPSQALGGAVFNMSGSFTAIASTFAANTAADDGASIYSISYDGQVARNAQITLRDTIVFDGIAAPDLASVETTQITPANKGDASAAVGEFDLIGSMHAVGAGTLSGTPLSADPQLGPLQANGGSTPTMAPAPGSPVVDAGAAFGLTSDQRGLPRPFDFAAIANASDGSDIGAVELQAQPAGPPPPAAAFGAKTLVTLALAAQRIPAKGPVKLRIANRNAFAISGRLSGQSTQAFPAARRKRVKLRAKNFRVAANSRTTVALKLPRTLVRVLGRKGRVGILFTARVRDPAGNTRSVTRKLTPKLRKKPRRGGRAA